MTESTTSRDAIGISLQLLSTFLAALAYVMQKQAHVQIEACGGLHVQPWSHPASKKALWRWRIGFIIMVICAILDLISYPLLDLSKQAPMGAVTLMWNTVLASIMLKERFTVLDLMSTLLIVVGTIMSVANSEAESTEFTFPQILDLLKDDLVYVYSFFAVSFILLGIFFVERTTRKVPSTWTKFQKRCISILSPCLGGMCMGYTGYGAKALSTVVSSGDWSQLKNPLIYLYAGLAALAVTGQLRYLNKGLEFFDALHVVPVFQVFIIFSNAMAGIVYYHDMRTAPAYKLLLFATGGIMCSLGIGMMLLKTNRPKGRGEPISKVHGERADMATAPQGVATESTGLSSAPRPRARTSSLKNISPHMRADSNRQRSHERSHEAADEAPSSPLVTGSTGPAIIRAISRSRTASLFGTIGITAPEEHFQLDSVAEASPAPDGTPVVMPAPSDSKDDDDENRSVRRKLSMRDDEVDGEAMPLRWYEEEVVDVFMRQWKRWFPNRPIPCCAHSRYSEFT